MSTADINEKRRSRWYHGGIASSVAVCITHPLDLMKVHLQTAQKEKQTIASVISKVYKNQGILGFYNGLSASLIRQMTYATTRIAIYEAGKPFVDQNKFSSKIGLATLAGAIGGIVGVPTDMVNVRMQNDMKLPPDQRRNYKHVFDGLIRVSREEGVKRLFTGATMAVTRGVLMTIGQNAVYDQVKNTLLDYNIMSNGSGLHFATSIIAAGVATVLTQPLDVLKTRTMNAKPGEYKNMLDVIVQTAKLGPLGFFKGFIPAFIRLGPQTIILFMLMEQLRLNYGYLPSE